MLKGNDLSKKQTLKNIKTKETYRKFVLKVQTVVATVMLSVWSFTNKVHALSDTEAADAWADVMELIWGWVPKIGAAICAVGMIEFALAFKSEDPDGKTRGLRTAAAGAMVIAAAGVGKTLTA